MCLCDYVLCVTLTVFLLSLMFFFFGFWHNLPNKARGTTRRMRNIALKASMQQANSFFLIFGLCYSLILALFPGCAFVWEPELNKLSLLLPDDKHMAKSSEAKEIGFCLDRNAGRNENVTHKRSAEAYLLYIYFIFFTFLLLCIYLFIYLFICLLRIFISIRDREIEILGLSQSNRKMFP